MTDVGEEPLPTGWAWMTLAQLASPEKNAITDGPFGSNLKTEHYTETGPRVIRLQNIGDGRFRDTYAHVSEERFSALQKHAIRPGDLAIATLGEILPRACVIPKGVGPAIVKADCIRFHPDSSLVLAAYLNYAVNSPGIRRRTSSTIHGVGRPRLRLADIKAITIPVAPRDEQSRIADALDELFCDLDAGVAALERVGVKLKLYRASVLKAAVEGALTAEWRAQHLRTESASELLERILAERRRRWEEDQLAKFKAKGHEPPKTWKAKYKDPLAPDTTNLPPLPEGWCWATVEQVATLVTDGDHNPPKRVSLGVAHLTAKNIRNLRLSFDDCSFITRDDAFRVFRRYQPKKGDLIVTCVGTVGRTAIVPDDLEFSPDRNLAAVRFSSVGPIVAYVEYFLEAPHVQTALMTMSGSTAQPHLYLGDLRTLPIALPPLAEQEGIVEAVEDQLSVIDHLEADLDAKLKNAQGLRQAILRHAFTGQLVSQDPNDEPASELLKRIAAERESRGASGSRRRRAHS